MRAKPENRYDDLRSEYDFDYTKAVRGKYCERLRKEGASVVVLEARRLTRWFRRLMMV